MIDDTCYLDWDAPFWGGEPGVLEEHTCGEPEGHEGDHRCIACGQRLSSSSGASDE